MVFLRCPHSSTQLLQSGSVPAARRSLATATNCSSAAFASETMPKSGAKTRLYVDVNETPSPPVRFQPTGVAVGPPVADTQHEVRRQHRRVAVALGRLESDHARGQPVVVGNAAPAHKCRHHRHIEDFSQLDQQIRRVGVDDAAACDEQRMLG
jgi:hypothetical protein